jgi:hypothetical protein
MQINGTNGEYRIADCRNSITESAAVACVDLAWARPQRNGVHVTYETHSPPELWQFVDAVYESLAEGGWALFDADDWLLPRLIQYLQEEWGDVAATYKGGGYRRVGGVQYESGGNGAGHYFTNGGYPVVFAHKGETDRETNTSARQACDRVAYTVRQEVDWGTLKPIKPYQEWLDAITEAGELVYIPCAGSAPAALALERLYGTQANFIAVDSNDGAREAYRKRREIQVEHKQTTL